ncbi:hypothetical protein L9F63_001725, partial [Diploptera punctata]
MDGPVVTSFYVTVKYLREVTPYFRKASIISEVGWELQRGFLSGAPPSPHSPQRADTRYLPLQLCYLVRNYRHPDPVYFRKKCKIELLDNILSLFMTSKKHCQESSKLIKKRQCSVDVTNRRSDDS